MFVRVIFAPFVFCFVGIPGSVDDSPSQIVEGKHESSSGESATYTGVNDAKLAQMTLPPQLKRLGFRNCEVTDAGLVHLKDLRKLEWLYLNDTAVTDEGLLHLQGLAQLRFLSVVNTSVTKAGIDRLHHSRPNVRIRH